MASKRPDGIERYDAPAGGWGALKAVAESLSRQQIVAQGAATLLKVNQPDGFDCPGCAWPDPRHTSSFEFCENGAKAVTWESTAKRLTPSFFASHTLTELWDWHDHELENQGRLTHPLIYDSSLDTYVEIQWDAAFRIIAAALNELPEPDMAEFYTSGRASNEAAFLFQLFVRAYGTNNFPDCSNMCHEATSVGLPQSIGVGKGTVTLEDFDHADAIFSFGHNPGTNHPRMMTTLREAAKRGVPIVVFNPLKERALERFASPQSAVEMATLSSTEIASAYHQVRPGGDVAVLKGMMKRIFQRDRQDIDNGGSGLLDRSFIAEHTDGIDALQADIDATAWEDVEAISGLTQKAIESAGDVYLKASNVILCYGMGITQHRNGTSNVQQIANFLMLRGNIGRQGAGICPLRGHSNVQGDRTVGITEAPSAALLDGMERAFGFRPVAGKGHNAVEAIEAIQDGRSKALICLGGNLAVAMSDPEATFAGMRKLDLAVHLTTKLNRSHLLTAKTLILLPVLGRTDSDVQATGPQSVTVEDSMSMVHASRGFLKPPSEEVRSEPAVIAGIAKATLGSRHAIAWDAMIENYDRIRDKIEVVFPDFHDFNARIRQPGGFRLSIPASNRDWRTPARKAQFLVTASLDEDPQLSDPDLLTLTTIRSHDQYNTTIYGMDDRYRGVFGRRDVIFLNSDDLASRGLADGDILDVEAARNAAEIDDRRRLVRRLTAIAYNIPRGSAAGYYPEMNGLIALSHYDRRSGTPGFKSIPIRIRLATAPDGGRV
ncbi:FdhF/YdeP family oxidoreductase [Phyllobacterium endophyticum]|uniref:CbbBc protein n=1 Tax=Phyllobacterium endophyticum TaxID=1149773 RepID=A0A2P7B0Q9_9HYPH|nr:FdhF/YdeP family oxidoreductase [Phyllobacterium endophyticum]MBB3237571.1 molybdopterin-dependent oxidoreductase alpha subunit [Phyllobacterium endophyticum]PSH60045.1 CbbBc protein [Phyllobacterium endophyticum]TYR42212.1 FdhF/YdeP family oxidoreductase [Phyllobacterium endophyticum]